MKTIAKTLTIAFIGTLVMSSCSNTKATTSNETSTKTKTAYDAQAKDSKAKTAVAVKVESKRINTISTSKSRKAVSTIKTIENNVRK